jgi:hypothetical protein
MRIYPLNKKFIKNIFIYLKGLILTTIKMIIMDDNRGVIIVVLIRKGSIKEKKLFLKFIEYVKKGRKQHGFKT